MRRFLVVVAAVGASVMLTAPAGASDTSVAKTLVLTQADVGTGYSQASTTVPDPAAFQRTAQCVGKPVPKRKVVASAASVFAANTSEAVLSSVEVVQSAAQLKQDVAVFKSAKFPDCLKQSIERDLPGSTVKYVTRSSSSLLKPAFGSTFVGALDIQVQRSDGRLLHVLEVGLVKGRAEVVGELQGPSGATNVSHLTAPLKKVNARLKKSKT